MLSVEPAKRLTIHQVSFILGFFNIFNINYIKNLTHKTKKKLLRLTVGIHLNFTELPMTILLVKNIG